MAARRATRSTTASVSPFLSLSRRPETWAEFLNAIRDARSDLGNPSTVWYRGHSRYEHVLIPSLLRHPEGLDKEQDLFNDYERSAAQLFEKREHDWQLLVDMQHYGIPTRLLDWTDVVGVAIAFALYDSDKDEKDSAIYVLDPVALNRHSGVDGIKRVPIADFNYKAIYWHSTPFRAAYPIAVDCPFQNERVAAQRGSFTVHGQSSDALENQFDDCLTKIIIQSKIKPAAREFLEYANLNAFTIYPDIVGMARHIARKHLDWPPRGG